MKIFFVGLALLAGACTEHDSGNILTRGMYASMSASANGDGSTDVSTTLYLEQPINLDFIELEGDDRLVAWQGTSQKTMTKLEFLNIVSYHASFDVDAADTEFRVEFRRTVDAGAPESSVTLPAPFDVTSTTQTAYSRAAELNVTWAPSGETDPMSWEASGDCVDVASGSVTGDPGTLTIAADTIKKKMQQDGQPAVPDSCMVTFYLRRSRTGDVDPAFEEGGSFTATQVRKIEFTSNP